MIQYLQVEQESPIRNGYGSSHKLRTGCATLFLNPTKRNDSAEYTNFLNHIFQTPQKLLLLTHLDFQVPETCVRVDDELFLAANSFPTRTPPDGAVCQGNHLTQARGV